MQYKACRAFLGVCEIRLVPASRGDMGSLDPQFKVYNEAARL